MVVFLIIFGHQINLAVAYNVNLDASIIELLPNQWGYLLSKPISQLSKEMENSTFGTLYQAETLTTVGICYILHPTMPIC